MTLVKTIQVTRDDGDDETLELWPNGGRVDIIRREPDGHVLRAQWTPAGALFGYWGSYELRARIQVSEACAEVWADARKQE